MELLVKIGAIYTSMLIIFHCMFWKLFRWKDQLKKISSLNRAVMQVLNVSLTFVFVIFTYISIVHSSELLSTGLGNSLLFLISGLWFFRAIQQIVFFSKGWQSNCFAVYFSIGGVIYGLPAIY